MAVLASSFIGQFPVFGALYVANLDTDTVSPINPSINPNTTTVGSPIVVGDFPVGIAFDPRYKRMYVTNSFGNTVSLIDTITNALVGVPPIAVGDRPTVIAFDATHERMYVTNYGGDTVSVIDTNTNTVVGLPLVTGLTPATLAFALP